MKSIVAGEENKSRIYIKLIVPAKLLTNLKQNEK